MSNAAIKTRRKAETSRGIGVMYDFFVEGADSAALWDRAIERARRSEPSPQVAPERPDRKAEFAKAGLYLVPPNFLGRR